jgi:hypothetical protein
MTPQTSDLNESVSSAINPPTENELTENNVANKEEISNETMTEITHSSDEHVEQVDTIETTLDSNLESTLPNVEVAAAAPIEESQSTTNAVVEQADTIETQANNNVTEISETPVTAIDEIHPIAVESIEDDTNRPIEDIDYSQFTKKDFVELGEKLLDSIKKDVASISDIKNADAVMREIKPIFDELKSKEKANALKKYIADNGNDEGFEYKNDNYVVRFEGLNAQIRDAKTKFFQKIEREKENYFDRKTQLLQALREIVEAEEKGGAKNTWNDFKKIQEDWKAAGNINSPHNASLWSAYNALIDRYFSIRHIQNELKDLDRKKNLVAKSEIVDKIEAIAKDLGNEGLTNTALKQANELLEEYKHIGPATREAQEELWKRLKIAFDAIHNKRREQTAQTSQLQEEIYQAKAHLVENLKAYTEFNTDSINEWNTKTKEILEIQDQWNAIKGSMPREKGKEISQTFWNLLKTFFKNKGLFFEKLEAEREENLKAKTSLCEQVEALLTAADFSPANTDKIIELQKTWKTIGHVPEKFKDKIYERFKKSCDAFFDGKRNKSSQVELEYEENLKKKITLCEEIEAIARSGAADLGKLAEYKAQYNAIGFVPRKDIQTMQRRFIDAINMYVKASSGVSGAEKEKMVLQNEVEVVLKGEKNTSRDLDKKETDIRRKIKKIEDDINLWQNNIEFFARSKNAGAVREEYEGKIKGAEKEIAELKQRLKIIISAN